MCIGPVQSTDSCTEYSSSDFVSSSLDQIFLVFGFSVLCTYNVSTVTFRATRIDRIIFGVIFI